MSTTNDEQAPYGKESEIPGFVKVGHIAPYTFDPKKVGEDVIPKNYAPLGNQDQRAPMLITYDGGLMNPEDVMEFYENLITKGVLRVVKKVTEVWAGNGCYKGCSDCGHHFPMKAKFCPGCGAEIVKPLTLDESSSRLSDVQEAAQQMGGGA